MSICVVSAQSFCVRGSGPFVLYTTTTWRCGGLARAHSLFNKLAPGRARRLTDVASRVSGWIVSGTCCDESTSPVGMPRPTDRVTDGHLASVQWSVTLGVTSLNGHASTPADRSSSSSSSRPPDLIISATASWPTWAVTLKASSKKSLYLYDRQSGYRRRKLALENRRRF